MGAPGFWDDQERAAATSAEHARAQRRLETFRALERDAADLDELAEMAADDPELAAELDWSRSAPAPGAPIHRTGPRCSSGCTCDGPSAGASTLR